MYFYLEYCHYNTFQKFFLLNLKCNIYKHNALKLFLRSQNYIPFYLFTDIKMDRFPSFHTYAVPKAKTTKRTRELSSPTGKTPLQESKKQQKCVRHEIMACIVTYS
jgi:hypothetical protein